ncbi:hypothetical protein NPIL_154261 [Nephila pilipes]|uniref:Uncharacterized protein n=1 Tax=Nephila pilipes TaxID=299642 RepID=A0A8X6R1Y8_NEPPI|nr:hypothetical protein NPIL_154261 [Nephila pilipes]
MSWDNYSSVAGKSMALQCHGASTFDGICLTFCAVWLSGMQALKSESIQNGAEKGNKVVRYRRYVWQRTRQCTERKNASSCGIRNFVAVKFSDPLGTRPSCSVSEKSNDVASQGAI